jgi:hypothetical protein
MIKTKIKRPIELQTLLLILLMLVAMVILTGGVISCSGSDESTDRDTDTETDTDIYSDKKKDRNRRARTEKSKDESASQRKQRLIKKVYNSPRTARVEAAIKINVETREPMEANQYLSFIYWRNGKKFAETNEDTLPPFSFKKGDVIYTDVLLYQDGELIEKKRTQMIRIKNSKPVIKEVIFPEVKGPGTYTLKVIAEDRDKDKLTFSLEKEELPVDVQVDPSTGVITCILDKKTPEILSFIVVVDDGDAGVEKKVLTMKFFKKQLLKKDEA